MQTGYTAERTLRFLIVNDVIYLPDNSTFNEVDIYPQVIKQRRIGAMI